MIVHSIIQLYSRKRIQWIPDVESLAEGTKSTISTLEESRVVSPTIEETALQYVSNNDIRSNSFEPKCNTLQNLIMFQPQQQQTMFLVFPWKIIRIVHTHTIIIRGRITVVILIQEEGLLDQEVIVGLIIVPLVTIRRHIVTKNFYTVYCLFSKIYPISSSK